MTALTLDPRRWTSERQVILEEVAMYESDPWDALEQAVATALFGEHPYARPVLGPREELLATGVEELAAFHRAFYRPDNAAMVVAGAVGESDLVAIESTLGALERGAAPRLPMPAWQPPAELRARRTAPRRGAAACCWRCRRRPRTMQITRCCACWWERSPTDARAACGGTSSRSARCVSSSTPMLPSALGPGTVTVEAELHEGADPREVEERVLAHLRVLGEAPLDEAELARARVSLLADWVFGNEQAHQQALIDRLRPGALRRRRMPSAASPPALAAHRGGAAGGGAAMAVTRPRRDRLGAAGEEAAAWLKSNLTLDPGPTLPPAVAPPRLDLRVRRVPGCRSSRSASGCAAARAPKPRPGDLVGGGPSAHRGHGGARLARARHRCRGSRRHAARLRRLRGARARRRRARRRLGAARSRGLPSCCSRAPFPPTDSPSRGARARPSSRANGTSRSCAPRGRSSTSSTPRTRARGRRRATARASPRSTPSRAAPSTRRRSRAASSSPSPARSPRRRCASDSASCSAPLVGGSAALADPPPPVGAPEARRELPSGAVDQAHLYLGHLTVPRLHPDHAALEVLGVVLGAGAGLTGRIPERLREREGLAYTAQATVVGGASSEPGRLVVYVATSPKHAGSRPKPRRARSCSACSPTASPRRSSRKRAPTSSAASPSAARPPASGPTCSPRVPTGACRSTTPRGARLS